MIYLFLAAICSITLLVVFKLFHKYEINANQAIIFNYISCVITGCITAGDIPFESSMIFEDWFPLILTLGFVFFYGFNIIAYTVRFYSLAVTTVCQKMSLAFSAGFAIWYYSESYVYYNLIGIAFAAISVILINYDPKSSDQVEIKKSKVIYLLPLIVLAMSTFIEIALQYLHKIHEIPPFKEATILFGAAAFIGINVLVYRVLIKKVPFSLKSMISGLLLGVPNYFSIYFVLLALQEINGNIVFSVNNIATVVGSTMIGLFYFKEKVSGINFAGIALAVIAVLMILL